MLFSTFKKLHSPPPLSQSVVGKLICARLSVSADAPKSVRAVNQRTSEIRRTERREELVKKTVSRVKMSNDKTSEVVVWEGFTNARHVS